MELSVSSPMLELLPTEILQHISGFLSGTKNVDIVSFACCSRACHEAAASTMYSTIRLQVSIPEPRMLRGSPQGIFCNQAHLIGEIDCWNSVLSRYRVFHQVRRLEVNEYLIREPSPLVVDRPHHLDLLRNNGEFSDPPRGSLDTPVFLQYAKYPPRDEEGAEWSAMAALIDRLRGLSHISFNCSRPLPQSVLRAVLRLNSKPNLHLSTFWFRNYLRDSTTDPAELPILLSPQTRSIRVRSCGYNNNGGEDYTHEAVIALANGLNSQIQHISLLTDLEDITMRMAESLQDQTSRAPWGGFESNVPLVKRDAAELASFELGNGPVYPGLLEACFLKCNMAHLSTLKLRIPTTHRGLAWLARNISLPSLKNLVLGIEKFNFQHTECGDSDLAGPFLGAIPPLRTLRFVSDITSSAFEVVLRNHGQSLRRLWFPPPQPESEIFFNPTRLANIRDHCPLLEDLALSIPRSAGDAKEVSIYRTLGKLPKLQRLSLALDCEDPTLDLQAKDCEPTPIYPSFDDLDKEFAETFMMQRGGCGRRPRKGHIRIAILNAAVDEDLARSIFHTISDAKPCDNRALSFQRLELRPYRGIYTAESSEVIEVVGRWWLLERTQPSGDRDGIRATKLRHPGDLIEEMYGPPQGLDREIEPIFRKIWPLRSSGEDCSWALDWMSSPLDTSFPASDNVQQS